MKPPPMPRIKIPAQARERIYRAASAFARSCADTMISNLENQLSAELHAAMRQTGAQLQRPGGLDAVGEGEAAGLSFTATRPEAA